jgi:serine/threonine-protein kinase RsbT
MAILTVSPTVVRNDEDVISARVGGRQVAINMGFGMADVVMIATAISEVARNIVRYADEGTVSVSPLRNGRRRGIEVVAQDGGPGIEDLAAALRDGYSTGQGLGIGLPGCRRLMDEFHIESRPGAGTTVTMRKWLA